MAKIIDSAGKGSAITAAEHDSNLSTFAGKNQSITATSHTIDVDDQGETIEYSNASPIAVTLPAISTVSGSNIHTDDFTVTLKNIGAGLVTVTRGGTDTFEDGSTSYTIAQYGSVTIQTDSTLGKWNIISRGFGTTYNDSLTFAGTLTVSGTANISGTFQIGGVAVTSSAAELNYNDITTLGTVQASKTVTADASKNVTALNSIAFDGGADALSHYEEGTWTPVIADSSLSAGESQTQTSSGSFTRIGNVVHFSGSIEVTSLGSLTTSQQANILGLPYQCSVASAIYVGQAFNISITAGQTITGKIDSSSSHIGLYLWDSSIVTSAFLLSELTASGILIFSGTYFV